jgi:16S rRNA (guanine(1405)-N(7))-methyltransferase
MAEAVDSLVAAVLRTAKYRNVGPEVVRRIGMQELARRRSLKEATKETKNLLHQAYGAFIPRTPPYERWWEELRVAANGLDGAPALAYPAFRQACVRIMAQHTSTAERLPSLEEFYHPVIAAIGPVHSVMDIGCGLHPLGIAWMGLPADVRYRCYDIDAQAAVFLERFFALAGIHGAARVWDAAAATPSDQADLAMVLKVVPVLDTLARDAGFALLRALAVRRLLVSFPTRSLGGRTRGMAQTYSGRFRALAQAEGWPVQCWEYPTELVYLAEKPSPV